MLEINKVAMKKGITKDELDDVVGIHPTSAEEFIEMKKLSSEQVVEKEGC